MLTELANLLEHFHFLRPAWALLLVPWAMIFFALSRKDASRDMFDGIIAPHLLEHLRLSQQSRRWASPRNFSMVIFILLLIVLMGPTWRQQPSPLIQDEAALVLLLDASASMTQTDIQPSRLERAKQKIADLLALRPDKKAALIVYAGTAHTVLTLTADRSILTQYLAAIEPEIMPRPGKFAERTLPNIDQVLRKSDATATVIMFADGLGSDSSAQLSQYFTQRPHQLLVIGVGTSEPSTKNSEQLIPLEKAALQNLAEASGGHYLDMTLNNKDVERANNLVNRHYRVVEDNALPWLDSGYLLLFPAMALFLMWFRRGWTLTWTWLLVPFLVLAPPAPSLAQSNPQGNTQGTHHWFADLWLTGDQQGRLLMQWEKYAEAATRFEDPMWKALAHYYDEKFMLAAQYFSRTDSDNALFNEANARAQARDYVRSAVRYDRLLARTPNYPGARENRQRVQELIEETNRLSESQQAEPGTSSEDLDPEGDDAIPAQGAEDIQLTPQERPQLTAEQILQDPATSEMWLRSVQHDPATFLSIKFNMQLQQREDKPQ
ncbi:MAG: Ca-activated chloride channel family protein [Halioglobus sp.]